MRSKRFEDHRPGVEAHFRALKAPLAGLLDVPLDLAATSDGATLAFTANVVDKFGDRPRAAIGILNVATGKVDFLRRGPWNDRTPRFSPDGRTLAFLTDEALRGVYQLALFGPGGFVLAPLVEGVIEDLWWSPDGNEILILAAGRGADLAGAQGSGCLAVDEGAGPAWAPSVEIAVPDQMWRRLWLWRIGEAAATPMLMDHLNVWEAGWCGPDHAVAVASDNPREGAWYSARLVLIDIRAGTFRDLYQPKEDQLGWPAASPDGRRVAVVEACCSDRCLVAGDLLIVDVEVGSVRRIDTDGVDVTRVRWRDGASLVYFGIRGFESVAVALDLETGVRTLLWSGDEHIGIRYPDAALLEDGGLAALLQSYKRFPAIVEIRAGATRVLHDFAHVGSQALAAASGRFQTLSWEGRDGLDIQGYLVEPEGPGPHPLVVLVHGGPVSAFRNHWSMGYIFTPLLVMNGYAVLHPNPRGSAGRGHAFAAKVRGDMGGEDTFDIIAGVQHLVARGAADPARIAVMGRSYGGFMSSWLVTQTDLFAAAVSMSPITDWLSEHLTSNVPDYARIFLADSMNNPQGRYFTRSPVLFAANAKTPTLNVGGRNDRCTPAGQALEFHRALIEHGVPSECVIYPQEGHHVVRAEAQVDLCARILAWLDQYMPEEISREL